MARGRHPYLQHPGPVAIAHRGGAGDAPENTMPAFEQAVALGYRYLETDAHVTLDGVVVAFHDHRLDRVSDTRGAIAELTIEELERADVGHAFSPDGGRTFPYRGRGVAVPRMEELLRTWPDIRLNIDPKRDLVIVDGPMDDLDHAALRHRFGGKLGVDATEKTEADGIGQACPDEIVMSDDIRALVTRRWAEYGL